MSHSAEMGPQYILGRKFLGGGGAVRGTVSPYARECVVMTRAQEMAIEVIVSGIFGWFLL